MNEQKLSFHGIPDEFTQGQIRVECPYAIQEIYGLEINRKLNQHAQVQVSGILSEEAGGECIHHVGSQDSIVVYGDNESGETLLFSGVVSEVEIACRDLVYYVEIRGLSWSSMMDYEEKSRSFQDREMSYAALIGKVLEDYPEGRFVNCTEPSDQTTGKFILQYRETDWAFCRRMATHLRTRLAADITGKAPCFWFGLPRNTAELRSVGAVSVSRDTQQYLQAAMAGIPVLEEQFVKYHIRSRERLGLGDIATYEGCPMVVEESRSFLEKGTLQHEYVLGLESSLVMPAQTNSRIQGVSLLGEVAERSGQQVKLKLNIDEGRDAGELCWFPYASQANNLFYCMPEIGTSVSLYFSDSDENSGIAMNAVRKNGGSCAKTANPKVKYMGIPEGKELKLGTEDVLFEAHSKLFMVAEKGSGVWIQSHKDLNIITKQKLHMEAKELIQIYAKTGNFVAGAKGESALFLISGADGDAHIKAGKKLIYDGRKKEVFTDRLNSAIPFGPKKFDWGKLLKNVLIGLAVVAAVVVVVATGGAALAAAGMVAASTVASVAIGAAVSGAIAVGVTAVSDIVRGEVSDWQDYALSGLKGAIEGAVSGALLGIKALQGAKLLTKMLASGGVSWLTDAISQGIDILFNGGSYDWKQGLLSFGIGFAMPAVAAGMRKGLNKIMEKYGKKMPNWLRKAFCKLCGEPVDAVSGNVIYDTVDFELPGPLPLQWRRIWCSASQIMGHLGHGMRYNYEVGLEELADENAVAVFLNDGRVAIFPYILVGEEVFSDENRLLLRRKEDHYQLFEPESRYSYLLYPGENGYMQYKLTRIQNTQGHAIQFYYDSRGWLCQVVDSVGRQLDVTTNQQGRITQVRLRGEGNTSESQVLVSYGYSQEQDLETVTDAVGAATFLKYQNHLLVKKTDRNRNSFYWEYDRYEDGARAVRTWGDGGVLSLWIDYHDEEEYNSVRTSREGLSSEYHYDENMLCTRIVYPDLTETRENYNEQYQLVSAVDEEGRLTSYQYNDWSQITEITRADASKVIFDYDEEGRLAGVTNPEGGSRQWIYHEDDTLDKIVDEAGVETVYQYNQHKMIEKVIYANKGEVRLEYDRHLNLSRVTLPDGSSSTWEYDQRGNCLTATNPMGAVERYQYDSLNRMVKATLADGNEIQLTYDAYQSVLQAKDKQTDVRLTYTILGSLASRTQGARKTTYTYDSEERLVSIANERGEVYQFERDVKGNVVKEVGYDGIIRTYDRDYSGLVTQINRPGDRFTKYSYDKLGRVIKIDYYDQSYETYSYDKNGDIIETENEYAKIKFERDQLGRITKEWQGSHWISCKYDVLGDRIQTASSFGANILTCRDIAGQAAQQTVYMDEDKVWTTGREFNALGQETRQLFQGNLCSSWEYDSVGRPVYHEVGMNLPEEDKPQRVSGNGEQRTGFSETLRQRRYEWDINYQLKKITDDLTNKAATFTYDQFSSLVCAKESGAGTIFRTSDSVGNLYETQDQSDRIYGAGSRMECSCINLKEKRNKYQGGKGKIVTRGRAFFYDEEGNLARKIESDGSTWTYSYFGNGMLREVIRPDNTRVRFKYDSLGRRIEKRVVQSDDKVASTKGRIIKFLWDGNVPFHEWEEQGTDSNLNQEHKVDFKADYLLKLEKKEEERDLQEAGQEQGSPDNLITWIFQDDFVPRAKITKNGSYSIISDYLGTPVEAYDNEGRKVWSQELDIYGRVKSGRNENQGDAGFIPFRFQGQYADEETGLYYNRFRYYSPEEGCYTQKDPIGLAGENPTLYGYVVDTLYELDPFGLSRMPKWMPTRQGWQRHHIFSYSIWEKYDVFLNSGMDVNGATNMTYLPVAKGIDVVNPDSSLHVGWNQNHATYNELMDMRAYELDKLYKENNWSQKQIQKEIRKTQREVKQQLKKGELKCH